MRNGPLKEIIGAALAIGLGSFMLLAIEAGSGIPEPARLETVSGKVSWIESHRHGTRFRLSGDARAFDYSAKGQALDVIQQALYSGKSLPITIKIDPGHSYGPVYSQQQYFGVWEISQNDKTIRTYEEIAAAWRSDDRLVPWLGWVFLAAGLYLAFDVLRQLRRAK